MIQVHYTLLAHDQMHAHRIEELKNGTAAMSRASKLLKAAPFAYSIRVQFNEENITITKLGETK